MEGCELAGDAGALGHNLAGHGSVGGADELVDRPALRVLEHGVAPCLRLEADRRAVFVHGRDSITSKCW